VLAEFLAATIVYPDIEEEGVHLAQVPTRRRQTLDRAQPGAVVLAGPLAAPPDGLEFGQLGQPDGRMKVAEVVAVPGLHHVEVPGPNLVVRHLGGVVGTEHPEAAQTLERFIVANHDHPRVNAGQCFDRVEAEHANVGEAADHGVVEGRPEGVGGVVHHPQVVGGGQARNGGVVGQMGPVVHGQDGPCSGADELGHPRRIQAQAGIQDVAQDGPGSDGAYGLDVGQVGEGRHDDLVAVANSGGDETQVERGVARAHGQRPSSAAADHLLDGQLELADAAAHAEPALAQHLVGGLELFRSDERLVDRDARDESLLLWTASAGSIPVRT
jgi:hypothetical protein